MKYRIHFTLKNGGNDFVTLEGDTIEDIQKQAATEISKRNVTDYWSEKVED